MRLTVLLSNIVRCLNAHYDVGPYHVDEVAEWVYKVFRQKIDKHMISDPMYYPDLQNVEAEFIARGFKPISEVDPDEDNNYVASIKLKQEYVWPEMGWHGVHDKDLYDDYIYDLQALVGIPGFTRSHIAGLSKRK